MEQLDFMRELEAASSPAPPLTPWERMKAGSQDIDWPEEKARIENERKMTMNGYATD